jgi:hypothetical protein
MANPSDVNVRPDDLPTIVAEDLYSHIEKLTRARELLAKPPVLVNWWMAAVVGAVLASAVFFAPAPFLPAIVAFLAGSGFGLACVAIGRCNDLGRRIDAVTALVGETHPRVP